MFVWRKKNRTPYPKPIKIKEVMIAPSNQANFLSLTLDSQLKWNLHIEKKRKSAMRTIQAVR